MKKTNKKLWIGLAVFALAIVCLIGVYAKFSAKPTQGAKALTILVIDDQAKTVEYQIRTDAEFLRQAMEETEGLTFSGAESEYGLMIDTVNGVVADYAKDGAYWAFYVNEEYCNYGVDSQPVNDGEIYKIEYTVY